MQTEASDPLRDCIIANRGRYTREAITRSSRMPAGTIAIFVARMRG